MKLTHGLFAHGTLVGITWRLIVMWVRNQTGTDTEDCERLYL